MIPTTAGAQLAVGAPVILPMSAEAVESVRELERVNLMAPQVSIPTHHVLHGGMYHRTIMIPAGVRLTGALVKVPTTLTISGDVTVFTGEEIRIVGYRVIPASAHRKQAFVAHADTFVTMSFPTQAATVEEAEDEFTDEAHRLMSRHDPNEIVITGER